MGNLGFGLKTHAVIMFEVGKLADETMDDFLGELDKVVQVAEGDAQRYADHVICLMNTIHFFRKNSACAISGSDGGLDLLRCERLNALDKASLQRALTKNYAVLVSIAPIAADSAPICTVSPTQLRTTDPRSKLSLVTSVCPEASEKRPPCVLLLREPVSARYRVFYVHASLFSCSHGVTKYCPCDESTSPSLNARHQTTAVLVEAHSYFVNDSMPEHHYVALPFIFDDSAPILLMTLFFLNSVSH